MFQTGEARGPGLLPNVVASACFTLGWPGD